MSSDVLVRASREQVEHKYRSSMENPEDTLCYWTVHGRPQQTEQGQIIQFCNDGCVYAWGRIESVEQGKIWFEPLHECDCQLNVDPPVQGFKYIDETTPEMQEAMERGEEVINGDVERLSIEEAKEQFGDDQDD